MKREVIDALREQFRPEFLDRVDEIVVFHALTEADLGRIVDLLVADLARRLAERDSDARAHRRGRARSPARATTRHSGRGR